MLTLSLAQVVVLVLAMGRSGYVEHLIKIVEQCDIDNPRNGSASPIHIYFVVHSTSLVSDRLSITLICIRSNINKAIRSRD